MTPHNDTGRPVTPDRRWRRSPALRAVAVSVVIVLCLVVAATRTIRGVEQRIAWLEQRQKMLAPQDDMASVRDAVATHDAQLKVLTAQQSRFSRAVRELRRQGGLSETLAQQLQAQQAGLNALRDSIEAVKASVVRAESARPAAPLPAEKSPPATKGSASPPPAGRLGRNVPFVLTGVEQRGSGMFAAVAPPGFRALSQVRLIGEGESVSGWTLVHAGHGQATFRVNGRLRTVSIR